jgi:hypothetical protein
MFLPLPFLGFLTAERSLGLEDLITPKCHDKVKQIRDKPTTGTHERRDRLATLTR